MKMLLCYISLLCWLSSHSQPEMAFPPGLVGIRSGKIVYHFNNLFQEGTRTVIIADSGRYVKLIE